jgi:TolB protein
MLLAALPLAPSSAQSAGTIVYDDLLGGRGLFTASPDMTNRTHLPGTMGATDPMWSPDGSGIAYLQDQVIKWSDADGSNQHVLLGQRAFRRARTRAEILDFDWSPDGTQLVVCARPWTPRGHGRTYVVTLATREFTRLIRGGEWVSWSSTGLIVISKNWNLVTINPDGSGRTRIVGDGLSTAPSWSPDGSKIAFQRIAGPDTYDINVVDADGSGRVNLTKSKQVDWRPTWSPDGIQIMLSRSRWEEDFGDLFVMQADGTGAVRLTTTDKIDEFDSDWKA